MDDIKLTIDGKEVELVSSIKYDDNNDMEERHEYFKMLKKPKETERRIHNRICRYLRETYPGVRFITTLDGEFFEKNQAEHVRALQHSRGAPDLLIFKKTTLYSGLAIELKKDGVRVLKKDGTPANEHFSEQARWLLYLNEQGWMAKFAVGYDQAKRIIDEYLK